ncbi:hypothetical protein FB566_1462 [Stackebrandtia endophytica]|uniref:Uncharacterized protein n=1 Tax=Stackebrandtia endophytica TaxID=1496996 RepID=A0A543ATM8_9ACTN|nr:hypothetical protein [Stackebrandtia endophytica]TQL75944.1 hypothetical protein FB566_1462 [Stackebrandtia endophytica]
MTPSEGPDAVDIAHFTRLRRIRGRITLVAALVSTATVVVAVTWSIDAPEDGMFVAMAALAVIILAGVCTFIPADFPPDRPVPDTPSEVGHVILSEVRAWDESRVSLVIEPLARPGTLVHGDVSVSGSVDEYTGSLVGFRRHPTKRHLVWIDRQASLTESAVAATAVDPDTARRMLRDGTGDGARVVALTVGTDRGDGRWEIHVDLQSPSGRTGRARCLLTADQLTMVEPGTDVSVVWGDHGDAVIRFPGA